MNIIGQIVTGRKNMREAETHTGEVLAIGTDYEEVSIGCGQFSTFIIRTPEGAIKSLPVDNCVILNEVISNGG